jgi:gas vesicle protein
MADNDNGSSGLGWFLAGLGFGALIGVLYAPKAGKETREDLMAGALEAKEKAAELVEQGKQKAAVYVEQGKQKASEYVETGRQKATEYAETGRQYVEQTKKIAGDYVEQGKKIASDYVDQTKKVASEYIDKAAKAMPVVPAPEEAFAGASAAVADFAEGKGESADKGREYYDRGRTQWTQYVEKGKGLAQDAQEKVDAGADAFTSTGS